MFTVNRKRHDGLTFKSLTTAEFPQTCSHIIIHSSNSFLHSEKLLMVKWRFLLGVNDFG